MVPYPSKPNTIPYHSYAHGSSGSDVTFISREARGCQEVTAVVSDASFEDAPYRTVVPKPWSATTGRHILYSHMVGDRLKDSDGKLICSFVEVPDDSAYMPHKSRIHIEAGHGKTQCITNEVFDGSLSWMRDLMAYGSINTRDPSTANQTDRLLLFDIGRGKIETASELQQPLLHPYERMTGVVIEPNIALISAENTILLADMKTTRKTTLLMKGDDNTIDPSKAVAAGCRIFFLRTNRYVNALQPDTGNTFDVQSLLGDRCFHVSTPARRSFASPCNRIMDACAWSPVQGPLAITTYDEYGLWKNHEHVHSIRYTAVHLLDTRRHVSFELPGSRIVDTIKLFPVYPRPLFTPTHVAGQPCMTMISVKGTFMIM